MDFRQNITALASVALVGTLMGKGLRYGLNVAIARGFGTDELGLFAFGMVLMKSGAMFAKLGLDNAALKFVPKLSRNAGKRTGTILICLGMPLLVGLFVGVGFLTFLGNSQGIVSETNSSLIPIFIAGIPIYAAMMVSISATQAFNETKYGVYIRDFTQSSLALLVTVAAAQFATQFRIAVVGYVLSFGGALLLSLYYIRKLGGFRGLSEVEFPLSQVLSFSIPLMLVAITQYLISWTDTLMIGIMRPAHDLGEYHAAFQTATLLLIVLQAVNAVFPPLASKLHDQGDWSNLFQIYTTITKWVFAFTLLGTAYLFLFRSTILGIFGIYSRTAEISLLLLAIGQLIVAGVGPAGFLLSMTGNERLETINTLSIALLNILLNIFLISSLGIIGAAIATAFSLAILNILRICQVWWLHGLVPISPSYLRPLICVTISTATMLVSQLIFPSNYLFALISGGVGILAFVTTISILGLHQDDRMLVHSISEF